MDESTLTTKCRKKGSVFSFTVLSYITLKFCLLFSFLTASFLFSNFFFPCFTSFILTLEVKQRQFRGDGGALVCLSWFLQIYELLGQGHTLRLLSLPDFLDASIGKILKVCL